MGSTQTSRPSFREDHVSWRPRHYYYTQALGISLLNITPAALTEKELKQRAQRRAELATDPVEKLRCSLLALGFAGIKEFAR